MPLGHGWSLLVVFLSFTGALGGVLVALTIKYADALAKTMAITGSIGVLTLVDYTVLSVPMSNCNLIGVACTMIGVLNYALDTTDLQVQVTQSSTSATSERVNLLKVAEPKFADPKIAETEAKCIT